MPTATEFFGTPAVNIGPLTTTFTAPSSCATAFSSQAQALVSRDTEDPEFEFWFGNTNCDEVPIGDCYVGGSAWDDAWASASSKSEQPQLYFSPGVACPSGWTTAGSINKDAKETASGIFAQENPYENSEWQQLLLGEYFANIMDDDERFAVCCPSGWKGDINGYCSSTIGEAAKLSITEYCLIEYDSTATGTAEETWNPDDIYTLVSSYGGQTWDPPLMSTYTTSAINLITTTYALTETAFPAPIESDDIYVVAVTPGVRMVYKDSDLDLLPENDDNDDDEEEDADNANETTGGGDGDDGDGEAEETGNDDEGSAGSLNRIGFMLPIMATALSFYLGSGLLL